MNRGAQQAKEVSVGKGPKRGSFPLDHLHECDKTVEMYFKCLRDNNNFASKCRKEGNDYLKCRVNNGLMSKDDFLEADMPETNDNAPDLSIEQIKQMKKDRMKKDAGNLKL
ncbi:hypothetical protein ABK040_011106 [Willaertia magna]